MHDEVIVMHKSRSRSDVYIGLGCGLRPQTANRTSSYLARGAIMYTTTGRTIVRSHEGTNTAFGYSSV